MDKDLRKKTILHQLVDMGETVNSWANKNGLHQRIVADLIDGKLRGIHRRTPPATSPKTTTICWYMRKTPPNGPRHFTPDRSNGGSLWQSR